VLDFDSVRKSDSFESFIPILNALLYPASITHGRRVLDVEPDRCYWGTNFETRIPLFEPPSSDVSSACLFIVVSTEICELGDKVANALIRFAWTVAGIFRNFAQGVVERLQLSARPDN